MMKKYLLLFLTLSIMGCSAFEQATMPQQIDKFCPKQARPVLIIPERNKWTIKQIAENYEKVVKGYLQLEETVRCFEGGE
jgi:hypothetical protein